MKSILLTQRDLSIILMAYSFGGITADHIRRRFFPTPGARSACYERVSRLVKAGYLSSARLPSLHGIGSGKAFLTPGQAARPLLARALNVSQAELRRLRTDSLLFITHHLAICDIRVSIELGAARSQLFSLLEWISDTELKHLPFPRVKDPKNPAKDISLIPDAAFTLALAGGGEQEFRLEVDLSTLSQRRLRAKLRGYFAWAATTPASPVLFVVPSTQRQAAIAAWAREEAADLAADPTIFWLTTSDRIKEDAVFSAPIWQIAGGPVAIALAAVAGDGSQPALGIRGWREQAEEGTT